MMTRPLIRRLSLACALVCGGACAFGTIAAGASQRGGGAEPAQQEAGPRVPVIVEPPVFDTGRVETEELLSAVFTIRNPTDTTLRIIGYRAGCKCTAPIIRDPVIPPGGSVEVEASVDVRGVITSKVNKGFSLMFEGYKAMVPLTIVGQMGGPISIEPTRLTVTTGVVTLRADDGRPFTPIAIHNEGAEYTFTALEPAGSKRAMVWRVEYALPSNAPDSALVIETSHRKDRIVAPRLSTAFASRPEVEYIRQRADIYSNRTHVEVGVLAPGELFVFETKIRRPDHTSDLEIRTELEGLHGRVLSHEAIPGEDQFRHYTIEIFADSSLAGQGLLTPIYFTTPEGPETRIWAMGAVEEAQ